MNHNDGIKTAILVDGGFYRRRAYACLGDLTPKERADELDVYCRRHGTMSRKRTHKIDKF